MVARQVEVVAVTKYEVIMTRLLILILIFIAHSGTAQNEESTAPADYKKRVL
ncbi:MAG: hypothetical protein ACI9P5_003905 [Saprospiraceae bacterium]|jgi:hypothetical protein